MDSVGLFRQMARARAFEDALATLWREGRISGEMHPGTGEEAVAVGVVDEDYREFGLSGAQIGA
jgi:TPP-dependent pyruvate/acetoin dehydrogenase alpha subunit